MKILNKNQKGQTLVILLVYMIIAITVTTGAVAVIISNSRNNDRVYQGTSALDIAENGAETAMIKLLRNTSYTGESITFGAGRADIQVITNSNTKTITSTGTLNGFIRTIQVILSNTNNVLTVTSWKEI